MKDEKLPIILGINNLNRDPSACLVKDGKIDAMVEEERFLRDKHAIGKFPSNSIKFCLEYANISLKDVDYIAIGWNINAYPLHMAEHFLKTWNEFPNKGEKTLKWELSNLRKYSGNSFLNEIKDDFIKSGYSKDDIPEILFRPHHYCHAISAYVASGFKESNIITLDGHGEENCTVLWQANGNKIEKVKKFNIPHSLGWFYGAFTKFVGFEIYDGEGKCMGLAPYGRPNENYRKVTEDMLKITEDGYEIDPSYLFYGSRTITSEFSDKFANSLGEYRKNDKEQIRDHHKQAAYEAQRRLEEVGVHLAKILIKKNGISNICLAGGVALNCKMNGAIHRLDEIDNIFIQPVSGDDGIPMGAAMAIYLEKGLPLDGFKMEHTYFGPEFTNEEIEDALKEKKLEYVKSNNISKDTAELVSKANVVGWFQGRMEVGPRALGNRSILADPTKIESQDIVNNKIKFRESWRPFCPSILYEHADEYLEKSCYHPFMILTHKIKEEMRSKIPSVTHVDGTARPQTVTKEVNEKYWNYINELYKINGVPVTMNTSFNVKGEPIVCTPIEAINCFLKTGMDALAIGDFLVKK